MRPYLSYLKQRGLLDETLIDWLGEFGRSPDNHMRGGGDEIGQRAVEVVHPIKDFHVTLLHLLGLDDSDLTYFHGGRFKQLSQTGGQVIKELIGS